jgi:hypothetical protein
MKRSIVWTVFFVAILSLSLAAVAKDREGFDGYKCSSAKVAGTWGYSETGTVFLNPTTPIPYASVGSYTLDRHGNLSGYREASAAGNILKAKISGTVTLNPDCTGTETLFFDDGKTVSGPAYKFVVYVDNAREARKILTNPGAGVLVTEAKKVSEGQGNYQRGDEEDDD